MVDRSEAQRPLHFMRRGYVLRDARECATNVSSKLNDSIRVLNFTRSDNDIIEGIVSHITEKDNSSFTYVLSDSGLITYIPYLNIIDQDDDMVLEYP